MSFAFHLFLLPTSMSGDRNKQSGALLSVSLGVDKEKKGYRIIKLGLLFFKDDIQMMIIPTHTFQYSLLSFILFLRSPPRYLLCPLSDRLPPEECALCFLVTPIPVATCASFYPLGSTPFGFSVPSHHFFSISMTSKSRF